MTNEISQIYNGSTKKQIEAINHIGCHARLLAGPGTGKTKSITRRVLALILKHNVDPKSILLLTFTRLSAAQLRDEIRKVLDPINKQIPQVSTIHSFALRQILYNSNRIDTLPKPIRIADDWEERHIIQEDIKETLKLKKIQDVRKLINQLSANWETLKTDEKDWEKQFPNPKFLGAWRGHKNQYGETLRAELVYQLKIQLNQNRDFKLDKLYKHVLIDEYQDLNPCDLAIVNELAKKGAELFVVGDDDQSIYGFRFASPEGIRNFPKNYPNVKKLVLETCFRCDRKILQSAEFIAEQDTDRLEKSTKHRDDAKEGDVCITGFRNQKHEAEMLARKIKCLIKEGIEPNEITILLRNDYHKAISKPIINALKSLGIDVSLSTDSEIDSNKEYRLVLSLIRLIVDQKDSLAWHTLLKIAKNRIGTECIGSISKYAQNGDIRFSSALSEIADDPSCLPKFGQKVSKFVIGINSKINSLKTLEKKVELIKNIIDENMSDSKIKEQVKKYFISILDSQEEHSLKDLIKAISISSEKIEQETKENAVNILTMHQAKGLTFDVCFIVGAEDEFIPSRNKEGDERRLLYVSMTRARHKLFITYCNKRTGYQKHSGRDSGKERRNLTRFLKDTNIPIKQAN
jgi:DNA helicase-2/ATP-dependent DNA helicase PcrA